MGAQRGEWSFLDAGWRCAGFMSDAYWAQSGGRAVIERLQAERIERLIAFTRRNSRYYRNRWAHLPARDLRLADLPPVRKAELMAHFDDWVTDPAVTRGAVHAFANDHSLIGAPFLGQYAVFSSSGTTGVPGLIVHDAQALAVYDALGAARMGALAPAWDWNQPLAGHRYALIAATQGHFAGVVGWERLRALHPWFERNGRVFPVTAPIRDLCAALDRFMPTVVASYSTVLRALAEEKEAGRLAVNPGVLWYGGEWMSPAARAQIERAFGCRVAGDYGASEFLNIAFECEAGALHVNDDWAVLEPVDEDYRPVPPDTPSASVLLTNLANRVQPLIRYDIGDSITVLPEPCPCGSAMPAIVVQGRCDDVLSIAGRHGTPVKLMPLALATVLEDDALVNDFQLLQTGQRRLLLRLGRAERARAEAACTALRGYLQRLDLAGVRVDLDTAPPRRDPASGKLRRVVNAVGQAASA